MKVITIFLLTLGFFFISHVHAYAQTDEGLRESIQSAVLSDPRAGDLPPSVMSSLIDALVLDARAIGMQPEDVSANQTAYTPEQTNTVPCTTSNYLCMMSDAFGFIGSNSLFAVWMWISAALLILLISIKREVEHLRSKAQHPLSSAR
jgi:hypothetical protein